MAEDNPVVSVVFGEEDPFLAHTICSREREQTVCGSPPEIPLYSHTKEIGTWAKMYSVFWGLPVRPH